MQKLQKKNQSLFDNRYPKTPIFFSDILSFPKNNGIMFNSRFDIAYEIENG